MKDLVKSSVYQLLRSKVVLISVLIIFFTHPIANILGATYENPVIHEYAVRYLWGFAPGCVFFCILPVLNMLSSLEGRRALTIIATLIQTIVDVVGNIVAVIFFDAGMFGIGIATTICYICATVFFLVVLFFKPFSYKPIFKDLKI